MNETIEKISKLLKEKIPNKTWQPKVLAKEIYEMVIKDGTLIELPCKVGDDFYYITMIWDFSGRFIGEMYKAKVKGFYVSDGFIQIEDDEIFHYHAYGEEAFLTKAEAEKRLKELRDEH